MTDTQPLTGAALNRAIAERLGWKLCYQENGSRWALLNPDNQVVRGAPDFDTSAPFHVVNQTLGNWMFYISGTDWAHDASLALALCLELIPDAWVCIQKWGVNRERYCATAFVTMGAMWTDYVPGLRIVAETEAECLARLALKALEGGQGNE